MSAGFDTLPRDVAVEIDMDRFEWWRATARLGITRRRRVEVQGGPIDGRAWDAEIAPDRILAPGGAYYPTVFVRDGVPLWSDFFDSATAAVYSWKPDPDLSA